MGRLLATAFHEAGHALADYRLDLGVKRVRIVQIGDSAGSASSTVRMDFAALQHETPNRKLLAFWHDVVISRLAGREAQRRFKPHSVRSYQSRDDMEGVNNILCQLHPENEQGAVYQYLKIRTRNLIGQKTNWRMIQDLAHVLIEKRLLRGDEVFAIFRASLKRQQSDFAGFGSVSCL